LPDDEQANDKNNGRHHRRLGEPALAVFGIFRFVAHTTKKRPKPLIVNPVLIIFLTFFLWLFWQDPRTDAFIHGRDTPRQEVVTVL
jgi:hypothetical protein